MELNGSVAVVTGGGRGIGAAICKLLAREGAVVVVNDLPSSGGAEVVAAAIEESGGTAEGYLADVTDTAAVEAMAEEVFKRHSRIDILVNNAGIIRDNLLLSMRDEDWDSVLRTNVGGAARCIRAF